MNSNKINEEQKEEIIKILGKKMVEDLIVKINEIETGGNLSINKAMAYRFMLSTFGANKTLLANLLITLGANEGAVNDALKSI